MESICKSRGDVDATQDGPVPFVASNALLSVGEILGKGEDEQHQKNQKSHKYSSQSRDQCAHPAEINPDS